MNSRVTKYSILAVGVILAIAAMFYLNDIMLNDGDPYEQQLFAWVISVLTGLAIFWTILCIVLTSKK
jgi:uncharacterized membrane protein YhaH (DUF805 family)